MIKFFRKIRQRLMIENKFSKYLIYAIGEIILVVIGILIALQVNNWNAHKKERTLESILLENLLMDLQKDYQTLNGVIRDNQYKLSVLDTVFHEINYNPDYFIDDFIRHNTLFPFYGVFSISKGTYVETLSSGKLSLILTDSLKSEISDYYEVKINYLGPDKAIVPLMKDLTADFNEMLSGTQEYAMALGQKTKFPSIDITEISNNPKFHRILTQKYSIMIAQIGEWQRFALANERLRNLVQRELDTRFK